MDSLYRVSKRYASEEMERNWLQLALPGWCLVPSFSCMARYRRNARVSLISNAQISVAAIATVALLAAHAQCAAPVARSLNLLTGVPAVLSNVLV